MECHKMNCHTGLCRLIGEPSGALDKSLDGFENSNIFFWCEIFISKQKFINI